MEVAADNKIWIWVVFMIISFAYNAWKKKNKARKEEVDSYDESENVNTTPGNFGLEDLISQFEEQYSSSKKEPQLEKAEKRVLNSELKTHEPQRVKETRKSPPRFTTNQEVPKPAQNKTERKSNLGKMKEMKPTTFEHENNDLEVDLRQMIISQTVLERPKY